MTVRSSAAQPTVAESRFNALLDAAVDAIVLIDERGHITRFNPAAQRMFGYAEGEVAGRNVSMLMPEPYRSQHDAYIRRYASTGERRIIGVGREVEAQRKDGSTFPIDLSVGEFSAGGDHGFVGIIRDLTEHKARTREADELRARLAHVGRLGTLGEMVSGIAHEVNQPLTAISNYASACRRMVQSGTAGGEELAGALDKIGAQAERAGQVIRGLRALVRRRDELREPLDVNRLIRDVAKLVEFDVRQAGYRLVLKLAEPLPEVTGDAVQVQQVVLNLIRNGLDAMLEQARGDTIEVETAVADGKVEIRVTDSGPGLGAAALERLFEPFFTTKPQGIGLGLSICKSIVGAHRGELRGETAAGGGARFRVRLPRTGDE
ncbi:MAG: two-component system sensor histidine kinase NtrB [Gammaproteobacteria bacterium]